MHEPDRRSVLSAVAVAALERGPTGPTKLLAHTERWKPAQLEQHQLWRLQDILAFAVREVPYYRERREAYAVSGDLSIARLRELPLLTRADVLAHATALQSEEPLESARRWGRQIARQANSSGSTGQHVTVQVDQASAAMVGALAERDHSWHGRFTDRRAAVIRAVPVGSALDRTGLTWSAAGGKLSVLEVHTPVREQLDWLLERRPAYISTYASNAGALLAEAERGGVRWPELCELGTFGERLGGNIREAANRAWGVPVVDAYSCVELGYIALQCSDHPHYHVQSEQVLVEVLRADGSACEPGETGRVVVTGLHGYAMPLVRYDVGDFATLGERCRCGRGLPVLSSIVGRVRNLLRLRPDPEHGAADPGDVLWPRYASNILGGRFPVRQFRLVQRNYELFELQLVAEPLGEAAERALRSMIVDTLREHLAAPPELSFNYVEFVPRGAGGKFEDFVCSMP